MATHQHWDDERFKLWVKINAEKQGMSIREVFKKAGITRFYLKSPPDGPVEGRSTNNILNLAEVLNASPAVLFGLPEMTPELEQALRRWRELEHELPADLAAAFNDSNNLRLKRMTLTAHVIAGQLAALIYAASDRADTDPALLLELIMGEINHHAHRSKEKTPSSGAPNVEEPPA